MKCAPQTDDDSGNSSLISDVLDFVSRELNQFVANATGGAVAAEPIASSRGRTQSRQLPRVQHRSTPARTRGRSLSLDGLQPSDSATQLVHESKNAPRPYIMMPGSFFPPSPTSDPDNIPDLHVSTPFLHDDCASRRCTRVSCQAYQDDMPHDSNLPKATTIPCVIPTFQDAIEGDTETMPSIEMGILDGKVRRSNSIDIIYPRPAAWKSTIRNDEHAGLQYQQQEPSLQKMQQERLHDKEKIRHLEEEIKKLKELLKKDSDTSILLPPPPPPPPPIRAISTRVHVLSETSTPSLLITSARASLKRAPTPVEAPINPPMPTKRHGLPAVGVPPDKMAAFLSELKNVRLRKVGSSSKQAPHTANLSTDSSISSCSSSSLIGDSTKSSAKSSTFNFVETGAKRKRELCDDGLGRVSINKIQSTQKGTCRGSSLKLGVVPWDDAGANSVTWPPNFANENTTPSLTSDNDHERDDISHEEHAPPTPPAYVLHHVREPKEVPEVNAYHDALSASNLQGSISPRVAPSQPLSMADIFARRPPTSPLPPDTPRKPYRPSKARRSPRLNMPVIGVNDMPYLTNVTSMGVRDSSNPLPPQDTVGQPLKRDLRETLRPFAQNTKGRRSRSQRKQTRLCPSNGAPQFFRLHRTLDEELRHAVKSLESIGAEDPLDYEECDAFIGVGSREKSCDTAFYTNDNAENKVK